MLILIEMSGFLKLIHMRDTNNEFLKEISNIYEKRNLIGNIGEYINKLNKEICDNEIRIDELKNLKRYL